MNKSIQFMQLLKAEVSKESLFSIAVSISKDIAERNLSFVFVILASNENENSLVSQCISLLVFILLSLLWLLIVVFIFKY